jgi:UDP-N-acetylmuramoyl-L-alanyl-D-glutamate--2,6-diaminopimelate ligase
VSARLSAVCEALPGARLHGPDVLVDDVVHDSAQAHAATLFCAVRGTQRDGHAFVDEALRNGATALLVEREVDVPYGHVVTQVIVPSVRAAMGVAASVVHGRPGDELLVLGVTGTNGKTTVTAMLEHALARAGMGVGVIGTLGARLHGRSEGGSRTTPEGTDLQRLLRSMRTRGADAVAMEVSSHGLDLHRVDGLRVQVAAFTNLTQDHLDWHGDMDRYLAAKARLFTPELAERGVVMADAPGGEALLALARIPMVTVGIGPDRDVRVRDRHVGREGASAMLVFASHPEDPVLVHTSTFGDFNLDNAILAVVTAITAGIAPDVATAGVSEAAAPPGRLEPIMSPEVTAGAVPLVLVDYAHTPDAVERVVAVGRTLLTGSGRLIVVLGAGGDRDRSKRVPMGVAAARADVVIVTDDNPRSEEPAAIRAAVLEGVRAAGAHPGPEVHEVGDRTSAIVRAVGLASADDVVLVLGRGHEPMQEVGGVLRPLDDRAVVREALAAVAP